jgi:serine/threonine-protein kinase
VRRPAPGWLALALATASGFLAGVLLVAALGGAKGATETVTRTTPGATVTSQPPAGPLVPDVVGVPLDEARETLDDAGFRVDEEGAGPLGVIRAANWRVDTQSPRGDTPAEPGSTVRLGISKP